MSVNGENYAWEDLKVLWPTGLITTLQDIEYGWEAETEEVYGQGAAPRGIGRGNLKFSGKVTLLVEEYKLLLAYVAGTGKSITRISPFTITANYQNPDQGLNTDQLLRCRFKSGKKKISQGDKKATVDLDIVYEDQEENGVSVTAGLNFV